MGCLYVLEGATLGGVVIRRHPEQKLRLGPDNGAAFFHAYGPDTGRRWREFCGALELALPDRLGQARLSPRQTPPFARSKTTSQSPFMTPSTRPPSTESRGLIDLSQCAREPVHLPGAIQPHGALFALDPVSFTICGVSENVGALFDVAPEKLLGCSIVSLGGASANALLTHLARNDVVELNPFELRAPSGQRLDAIVHRHDGRLIVECEPERASSEVLRASAFNRARGLLLRLRASVDLRDLCLETARGMRALTGFDRVLVYKFHHDWSGEVVAEACPDGAARYLGLRFPASDIPSQARALYLSCRVRMVPTAIYAPARIVARAGEPPLDLTHAALRSISPVHREYMTNMGVTASLGVSLIHEDRLWGLITCNHESGERFLPYEVRAACDLVSEVVSTLIRQTEGAGVAEERARYLETQAHLVQSVVQAVDVVRGLTEHSPSILDVSGSPGAALFYENEVYCLGVTPPREAIAELVPWLEQQKTDAVVDESLPARYAPAMAWRDSGCGLLASRISRSDLNLVSGNNWILWFRPEVIQTVAWGGDPTKVALQTTDDRLQPRKSFDLWKEDVHLKAMPFGDGEIAAAKSLAESLTDVVLEIEASRRIKAHSLLLDASNRELRVQIEENGRVSRALEALSEQLRQREKSLQLVLDATGEGVISVALDGTLLTERSRAFEQWFPDPPPGAFIWDVLFPRREQGDGFACLWEQLASDLLPFEVSADQMSSEVERDGRLFHIGYAAVREGAELSSILLTLEDVTEAAAARRAAGEAAEARSLFASVLRDARGFGRALADLAVLVGTAGDVASPSSARRALHTLKGNAGLLGLETLARLCHDLEDRLAERADVASPTPLDLRPLDDELARVLARVHALAGEGVFDRVEIPMLELSSLIALVEGGGGASEVVAELRRWALEPLARPLGKLATRARTLAARLEKNVEVVVSDGNVRGDPDRLEPVWGALAHAVSNAVDHGIEPESVRRARGKPARGRITLTATANADWMALEVADDGGGVDLEATREAAHRQGLPCSTRAELLEAIFVAELSTRTEVTTTSGRGIGLAALSETCKRLGGTVELETEMGVGTTLRLRIPLGGASESPL